MERNRDPMEHATPPATFGPAWRILLVIALLATGGLLLALWPFLSALGLALARWSSAAAMLLVLFTAGALGAALWMLGALALRLTGQARQAHILTLPGGLPTHVGDVRQIAVQEAHFALDRHYAALLAEATREHPLLTSQNLHVQQVPPPAPQIQTAPQLIATTHDQATWMAWVDEQPHTLLAGKTKAGKTHLATALLERRLCAGEAVFIIDPHASDWLGLPTAGGVANPKELKFALVAVLAEYTRRMKRREDHKKATGRELPDTTFPRLSVLIDECNEIAAIENDTWATFSTKLASGSRKVGIALIILAQSPNVDDIGFSAKMRNNFAAIALDAAGVQQLINQEGDKDRKLALREAARAAAYPAAALIGSDVWLLDRDGLAAGTAPNGAQMWDGWDYAAGRAVTRPSGALTPPPSTPAAPAQPVPPTQRATPQPPPPTDPLPPLTVQEEILLLLSNQSAWLTASEIAPKIGVDLAVVRVEIDTLYHKAGKLVRQRVRGGRTKETYEYQVVQPVQFVQPHLTPAA